MTAEQTGSRLSRHAAAEFAASWANATDEKQSAQSYWSAFFRKVVGLDDLRDAGIEFEYRVRSHINGAMRWIDVFWPGVVLIEHKSAGKSLDAAEEQAREYLASLPAVLRPQHVIVCDFQRWRLIDIATGGKVEFSLLELPDQLDRLDKILAGQAVDAAAVQAEADKKASALMTALYRELERTGYDSHSANILLARLLFLMFGDDTDMFPVHGRGLFQEYILDTREDGSDLGGKLAALFAILNKPIDQRQSTLSQHLAKFPYVNGGIFAESIEVPSFDAPMRRALLEAANYSWASIDTAIFGALFQNVKSKSDRHQGGEHYTSEKDILKSLRPLFLDEFEERVWAAWLDARALESLRQQLGQIRVFDPACGSGNYLIVAFRELRNLEIQIIARVKQLKGTYRDQGGLFADVEPVVALENFYGIEVEEWPAVIARTAMYLTDHQLNRELDVITGYTPVRFPLVHSAHILQANSLRTSWTEVCPHPDGYTFLVGNPPFLGTNLQSREQKADQRAIWDGVRGAGSMDYVANWHLLAARYLSGTSARAAFLSTNSIVQGEQVAILWGQWTALGIGIDFAYQSFQWRNGASNSASVYCVVIGFSQLPKPPLRRLWRVRQGRHERCDVPAISPYLVEGPEVVVSSRQQPLLALPAMRFGSMPRDNGHLSKISQEEAARIRSEDPSAAKYLRRLVGAEELVHGLPRWCLWLVSLDPVDVTKSPELRRRIESVRTMRAASKAGSTRAAAQSPSLFVQIAQPSRQYLAVPRVSSESRKYTPMAFMPPEVVASDLVLTIEDASMCLFGILSSRAFSVWNRTVSGRLGNGLRISQEVTYNNFPFWPEDTPSQKAIENAALSVLSAREQHKTSPLATLYDEAAMPPTLAAAHNRLDSAVLTALGLTPSVSDDELLQELLARYARLAEGENERT